MPTPREMLQQGLGLHQAGDLRGAERCYLAVLETEPRNADAHHLLGTIALAEGQPAAAIGHITTAIDCNPSAPQFYKHLGTAREASADNGLAADAYRRWLAMEGESAAAHLSLANALKAGGQLVDAETHYRRALVIEPANVAAHNNLADALQAQGRLADALASFQQAARLGPDLAEVQFNLGNCYKAQQMFADAATAYRSCVALRGDLTPAWQNLGEVLTGLGQYTEAAECHRAALRLAPNDANAHCGLGVALQLQDNLAEAKASYHRALEIDSDHVSARFNLASTLQTERRLVEAQAAYEECARLVPDSVNMLLYLGKCLQVQGKFDDAIACYRKAIAMDPDFKHTHYFLGALLLARGDYEAGWVEYEWRLRDNGRSFREPQWDGRELDGRHILVHAEWGLGDTLLFARYVPMVEARGGTVILEAQRALIPLLRHSGFNHLVAAGEKPPPYDVQIPLLSLPRIFGTTLDSVPTPIPYLAARDVLVDLWRDKLRRWPGYKVGVQWEGSPVAIGEARVIPLSAFEPVARVPGVTLFSLQKHEGTDKVEGLGGRFEVVDFGDELDEAHGPFMDTAAIMKNLDLVITSDTSTAHLAGALGVPVWVALPYAAEWRWLERRQDSPWYPTMRLFRQRTIDDWDELFARIAAEMAKIVAPRRDE